MVDKDLNLFNERVAECVHLCFREEVCTSSSWEDSKTYAPGTLANSQRMPTKINESNAIAKR